MGEVRQSTLYNIDNHGSGYLGMARCFNVHRQLPVSKETVISQHRKFLDKTRCTSVKTIINVSVCLN